VLEMGGMLAAFRDVGQEFAKAFEHGWGCGWLV
jgi:hypothetical protein